MPFCTAPRRFRFTMILKTHAFIHLHQLTVAGQDGHPPSLFLLPPATAIDKFPAESLLPILRKNIKPHNHQNIACRIMQRCIRIKFIPEGHFVCRYAIDEAQVGDVIVLAGKGHEDYQEIKGVKYHMDERELIADILQERGVSFE